MERFLASFKSTISSTLSSLASEPEELSFDEYVELLKKAPGASIAEKVNYLADLGLTLDPNEKREPQDWNPTNSVRRYLHGGCSWD